MGAGRLFCLLAVLTAAAGMNPASAASEDLGAAPAGAVVSPFEALEQGPGLELRDASNRLISRGDIARTLKDAQRAESAVLAAPAAKAWADFVERADSLARSIRVEGSSSGAAAVTPCTASREPKVSCPTVLVRLGDTGPALRSQARGPAPASAPDRALNLPLRC
ncbi:MAG: hypothetical protein HY928_15740 [Elusimicrobia bacterium]|nr:hypothetical protein [Elusimicrobiota bacterium]